jgi:hypothetical protein
MSTLRRMRGVTGRAVSAGIHSRLRDALASGEPRTYAQLADAAGCTVRSVRNYLAHAEAIFGFKVVAARGTGRRVLVKAASGKAQRGVPDRLTLALGPEIVRALFGAEAERQAAEGSRCPFSVALRGLPAYGPRHAAHLEAFCRACEARPLRAVRLVLESAGAPAVEIALWPLRALLHNHEGLLLVGLPVEADTPSDVRAVNLASLAGSDDAVRTIDTSESGQPTQDLDAVDVEASLELPFLGRPDPADPKAAAQVHVRFEPSSAATVRGRVWHRSQRMVVRADGSVDVRFGPVDLGTAASWVASFGRAARVLGDKRLRKAVKKRAFVPQSPAA